MHVLRAGPDDPREGGFNHGIAGELVYLGLMCATDEKSADPGAGKCGCGRSFAGATSKRATTVAIVDEVDMTRDEYVETLCQVIADDYRWNNPDDFREGVEDFADIAADLPIGTHVFRNGDTIYVRVRS